MPSNTADVSDTFMRQNTYGEFQIQNTFTDTYSDYIQLIRLSNFLSTKLKLDGKWQNPITIGKKILRKCVLSSSFYYLEVVLLFV